MEEAELITRSQQGNTASFDALVQKHYSLVFNIAYRMLSDQEQAADATQLTFVRAFRSLGTFRGDAALATWLYRIAVNVCLDQVRRQPDEAVGLTLLGPDGEGEQPLPDSSLDPARVVERQECQRLVHEGLARLATEHRSVLVLYDLHGMSYEEIAEVLQIPLGTVKSRLNRARHALKQILYPHLELFE
jgi:RNA polymerase sigma-70 factor, ECF subfamily